jgi:hypothetical protein
MGVRTRHFIFRSEDALTLSRDLIILDYITFRRMQRAVTKDRRHTSAVNVLRSSWRLFTAAGKTDVTSSCKENIQFEFILNYLSKEKKEGRES